MRGKKKKKSLSRVPSRGKTTINRARKRAQNKGIVSNHRSLSAIDGMVDNYLKYDIEGTFDRI
jgi:hypothetical protein